MRLSTNLDELQPEYDAIVVGSGYGGGVAASRLARIGLKVAVLERGREFALGAFPDTMQEATEELQYTLGDHRYGRRTGLYDLHVGRDMHVLTGCGLGGTSLINANVSLPPDPRVWEDPRWPSAILSEGTLEEGFQRATRMLRPVPYPDTVPLEKRARFAAAATALGAEMTTPPINVTFTAGPNAAGIEQPACTLCGDCCSGCNVGAKNTVQMTYLPDAARHGASIFTEATVSHVHKDGDGWRVYFTPTRNRRDMFGTPERSVRASIVVLGAGALGSTEILLRSREAGLAVSERLGDGFTGNGDVLAFAYNGDQPANAVGIGHPPRGSATPPGPCITGAIDLRASRRLEEGMIIEEGVLPSGLAEILPATFSVGSRLFGRDTDARPDRSGAGADAPPRQHPPRGVAGRHAEHRDVPRHGPRRRPRPARTARQRRRSGMAGRRGTARLRRYRSSALQGRSVERCDLYPQPRPEHVPRQDARQRPSARRLHHGRRARPGRRRRHRARVRRRPPPTRTRSTKASTSATAPSSRARSASTRC